MEKLYYGILSCATAHCSPQQPEPAGPINSRLFFITHLVNGTTNLITSA